MAVFLLQPSLLAEGLLSALTFCIIITTFLLSIAPLRSLLLQPDLIDRHIPPTSNCKVLSSLHIPRKMAGPSTNTTQRLLRELKDYAKSPNEALLHLGPVDDEDLLRWEAVLKGVNGTPYEGTRLHLGNPVTTTSVLT